MLFFLAHFIGADEQRDLRRSSFLRLLDIILEDSDIIYDWLELVSR